MGGRLQRGGGLWDQMLQMVKEDEVLKRLDGLGRKRSVLTSLEVVLLWGAVGWDGRLEINQILRDNYRNG